jgi:hypothetical protein
LRLEQADSFPHDFVHVHALKVRPRHTREIAEAADDRIQVAQFGQ